MSNKVLLRITFSTNSGQSAHERLQQICIMTEIGYKKVADGYILSSHCLHILLAAVETLSVGEPTCTFVVYWMCNSKYI